MRNNLIKNNELKPVSIVNVAGFWGGAIHNPEVNGLQSIYDDDFQVLTFFRNHSYLKTSFPQQKSLKGIANDYLIHSKFQTDCNLIETWCSRCFSWGVDGNFGAKIYGRRDLQGASLCLLRKQFHSGYHKPLPQDWSWYSFWNIRLILSLR